ncbi:MAG: hypothetical protein N3C57_07200 [Aquificaceae bacterium]|nr:hypothetical protein [Aquificaceae bacterium]
MGGVVDMGAYEFQGPGTTYTLTVGKQGSDTVTSNPQGIDSAVRPALLAFLQTPK